MASAAKRPPWKRTNPKRKAGTSVKLSSEEKAQAKAAAKKGGRRYPNLVDNMRVAAKRNKRSGK